MLQLGAENAFASKKMAVEQARRGFDLAAA
jgi:hypothetical protein